jgi:putative ABC transport system substrate-binding protein
MRRREFLSAFGIVIAASVQAHAQRGERVRRIGMLGTLAESDRQSPLRLDAFVRGLEEFGWIANKNVQIEVRWGAGNASNYHKQAAELVASAPDVLLASGGSVVGPLLQATRKIPIVFAVVTDPVGAGYVESLARPGGNATGFTQFEYGISIKWLELLKEIAPNVTRVAILRDPTIPSGIGQFAVMQSMAQSLAVDLRPVDVRDPGEIERTIVQLSQRPGGGLVIPAGAAAVVQRDLIVKLAALHKIPAVYSQRFYVSTGGLVSYGSDSIEAHRRAASYVSRILKGENPTELPVQAPTRYELVVNLKTARALGLTIPPTLLARADEVIE